MPQFPAQGLAISISGFLNRALHQGVQTRHNWDRPSSHSSTLITMSTQVSQQIVLCLSGGMDSTALLLRYLAQGYFVHGISFDYGQKHRLELDRLQANLAYFRQQGISSIHWSLVDLSTTNQLLASALTSSDVDVPLGHYEQASMKSTFVPNRNAIFCAIAYGHALSIAERTAQSVKLGLGVHSGDHAIYPDCRPDFYKALLHAFQIGNWNSERIQLELPYLHWNKADILKDARRAVDQLNLNFATVFRNTCTSYLPDSQGRSLGLTGSDVERILAFHQLGWVDPLDYQVPWQDAVEQALVLEQKSRADGPRVPPSSDQNNLVP